MQAPTSFVMTRPQTSTAKQTTLTTMTTRTTKTQPKPAPTRVLRTKKQSESKESKSDDDNKNTDDVYDEDEKVDDGHDDDECARGDDDQDEGDIDEGAENVDNVDDEADRNGMDKESGKDTQCEGDEQDVNDDEQNTEQNTDSANQDSTPEIDHDESYQPQQKQTDWNTVISKMKHMLLAKITALETEVHECKESLSSLAESHSKREVEMNKMRLQESGNSRRWYYDSRLDLNWEDKALNL